MARLRTTLDALKTVQDSKIRGLSDLSVARANDIKELEIHSNDTAGLISGHQGPISSTTREVLPLSNEQRPNAPPMYSVPNIRIARAVVNLVRKVHVSKTKDPKIFSLDLGLESILQNPDIQDGKKKPWYKPDFAESFEL